MLRKQFDNLCYFDVGGHYYALKVVSLVVNWHEDFVNGGNVKSLFHHRVLSQLLVLVAELRHAQQALVYSLLLAVPI